jgi:hypothetical protein
VQKIGGRWFIGPRNLRQIFVVSRKKFVVGDERVGLPLVAEGRGGAMAGNERDVVAEWK